MQNQQTYIEKYLAKGTRPGVPVHHIQRLHSYRATLVPHGVDLSDVEDLADAKMLPTIRLKAANAEQAEVSLINCVLENTQVDGDVYPVLYA